MLKRKKIKERKDITHSPVFMEQYNTTNFNQRLERERQQKRSCKSEFHYSGKFLCFYCAALSLALHCNYMLMHALKTQHKASHRQQTRRCIALVNVLFAILCGCTR
jgi:hypothetical protein